MSDALTLQLAIKLYSAPEEFGEFSALKPPKRGGSRESIPTAANALRRGYIDQVAATDESLRAAWRYGCWLFNNKCYICGEGFKEGEYPQADHVTPPELGGSTNAGNMLPAHSVCNDLKGNSSPEDYFKDKPQVLALLRHYQEKFNFVADPSLYPLAFEKVNGYIDMMKRDILKSRNARELANEDFGEDALEFQSIEVSPHVKNLMKAVTYYFQVKNYAPTATSKMTGYARRILQSWYSMFPDLDLFTQDEETLRGFIRAFCMGLTAHPDSFSRAHRAFRILGEVFESKSLVNIYADGAPVTLAELKETHEYVDGNWRKLQA